MRVIVNDADAEEEHARDETMTEHLDGRARQRCLAEGHPAKAGGRRRHTQQDHTHMADAGVSDQLLHIGLHQADARPVNNVNGSEHR